METTESIQSSFLEEVRKRLPANLSLADELAEILNISRDSAYRRIRGETILSLDEVKTVCSKFNISVDSLLAPASGSVIFQLRSLDAQTFSFDKYLLFLLEKLEMIQRFPDKELIWYAKDLPIWHYFQMLRLSAFKLFFWDKTFVRGSKLRTEKYRQDLVSKEVLNLALKVWTKYSHVPSTEIISSEALNSTLNQIEFAYACGVFETQEAALTLLDDCIALMKHIKEQSEEGVKKTYGTTETGEKFNLYHNEVLIGDNTVLFKIGDRRVTFITANQFSILTTTQESFCKLTEDYIANMINKSTLISGTAEKERSKVFNSMIRTIEDTKSRIK